MLVANTVVQASLGHASSTTTTQSCTSSSNMRRRQLHQESISTPHKLGPEHNFKLAKALIVTKLSRLELEQHRYATLSQPQLEKLIRDRGTDYDSLVYHHHLHKNFQQRVADSFKERGVKVQLANR